MSAVAAAGVVAAVLGVATATSLALGLRTLDRYRFVALAVLVGHGALFVAFPLPPMVSNPAVVLGAAAVAVLLADLVDGRAAAVAFAVAAAMVDLWSFTDGFTRALLDAGGGVLALAALTATVDGETRVLVGLGDLAVAATLGVVLVRTGAGRLETIAAHSGALVAAVLVGLVLGGAAGLPFLALATLVMVWSLNRRESAD